MNATKITEARATITSLRGQMMEMPGRLEQMSHADIKARLEDFGQVLATVASKLGEVETEIEDDKEYN